MADDPEATSESQAQLRRRAESLFRTRSQARADRAALSPDEIRDLVHELQVHQIELEMQNEELQRAQDELAAARDR